MFILRSSFAYRSLFLYGSYIVCIGKVAVVLFSAGLANERIKCI